MPAADRADHAEHASSAPALIGIDWGSSSLRVALLDSHGSVLERRESAAGVFAVTSGNFAAALWPLCADWLEIHQLPLLACGMIGSRQGILEVPYVACPATADDLAGGLGRIELQPLAAGGVGPKPVLLIVPGLSSGSATAGCDVMRGEETQLLGVASESGQLFVMPGTHSKWAVRGTDGRLESFQTYMTGELFELLSQHGSLSRLMSVPQPSPEAFTQGVTEARDDALENLLFRVRTAGLMGRFSASALADYLSGLLIGAEIKAGLQRFAEGDAGQPVSVLGNAALTARYAAALEVFGRSARELPGDAAFDGLMAIARRAGLLPDATAAIHPESGRECP